MSVFFFYLGLFFVFLFLLLNLDLLSHDLTRLLNLVLVEWWCIWVKTFHCLLQLLILAHQFPHALSEYLHIDYTAFVAHIEGFSLVHWLLIDSILVCLQLSDQCSQFLDLTLL